MNIVLYKNGEHLLTNEGLKLGDHVFPLVDGLRRNGKFYVAGLPDPDDSAYTLLACTGFPSEPHTITEFYQDAGIPCIRTDKGYSPAECYFKTIEETPIELTESELRAMDDDYAYPIKD